MGNLKYNDNSTKEKVYDAIAEREAHIIRQIPELESFFKCNNSYNCHILVTKYYKY